MLLAIGVALIATGLGAALATLPATRDQLVGPIRTFALTASLAVVLAHLLPEADVCAASATPLAAVLIAKGLSPGAVLVGLLLGPPTNVATLAFVRTTYGIRATALCLSAVVSLAWAFALLTNRVLPVIDVHAHAAAARETHGLPTLAGGVLLAVLLVRSIWLAGARSWLASLGDGHSHDHDHAHAHDHDRDSSRDPTHEHGGHACGHDHAH